MYLFLFNCNTSSQSLSLSSKPLNIRAPKYKEFQWAKTGNASSAKMCCPHAPWQEGGASSQPPNLVWQFWFTLKLPRQSWAEGRVASVTFSSIPGRGSGPWGYAGPSYTPSSPASSLTLPTPLIRMPGRGEASEQGSGEGPSSGPSLQKSNKRQKILCRSGNFSTLRLDSTQVNACCGILASRGQNARCGRKNQTKSCPVGSGPEKGRDRQQQFL